MGRVDLWDLVAVLGLAMLGAGLAWIWPPLGLIVPGALLFALGLAVAVIRARRPEP